MTPYFDADGHLTDFAFDELLHGEPAELTRLEIAEHLSFCDKCTERYADLLCGDALLDAPETLHPLTMRRLRQKAAELFFNRYVAVGVAACLTMLLWLGGVFNLNTNETKPDPFQGLTSFSTQFSEKTNEIGRQVSDGIQQFFDHLNLKGASGNEKK